MSPLGPALGDGRRGPRPAYTLEGLDDEHAGAAAGARARRARAAHRRARHRGAAEIIVGRIDGLHAQQLARLGEVRLALAVGEQAVVADAVEALRQHVDEEAADELVGCTVIVLYRPGPSIR